MPIIFKSGDVVRNVTFSYPPGTNVIQMVGTPVGSKGLMGRIRLIVAALRGKPMMPPVTIMGCVFQPIRDMPAGSMRMDKSDRWPFPIDMSSVRIEDCDAVGMEIKDPRFTEGLPCP